MSGAAKYVWAALAVAVLAHLAFIHAVPRVLMSVAMTRVADGATNAWRLAERVTPASRAIVRPSPDFAYSACPYDLSEGPIAIRVAPWDGYWSLSLYAANSDNFFVIDDRETDGGVEILLSRGPSGEQADAGVRAVRSPSARGIALIRRLAPTQADYDAAAQAARGDVCAPRAP